ncbi:hypothetical protein C5746_40365 [Streptomyces atratus]|uniref:Uncharacterized protein n=1 Tax=Streptomyces atratus TaxID=1893 RepID=A0A2Z5JP17_STRAR|nr:hypothetical protein C5746_40365 [Streptomyces atratus]
MILICRFRTEREKACLGAVHSGWVKGSAPSGRNHKGLSTESGSAGGPVRSSDEASVMGVERRGRAARDCCSFDQPG